MRRQSGRVSRYATTLFFGKTLDEICNHFSEELNGKK
jgi:hypothetical protein